MPRQRMQVTTARAMPQGGTQVRHRGGLGLGLGLNPRQQGAMLQAQQQGTMDQFLANRPQLNARLNRRATSGTPAQQQAAQQFGGTPTPPANIAAGVGGMNLTKTPQPPPGAGPPAAQPAGGAAEKAGAGKQPAAGKQPSDSDRRFTGGQDVNQPGNLGPGLQNTVPAAAGGPSYQQAMDKQFGQGNPFASGANPVQDALAAGQYAPQQWYGGNPLETAQAVAERTLGKQLGELNARYGAMGMGNSSRAALAQGTAIGEAMTGLGDVLAGRGQAARSDDFARLLQAQGMSGQQGLQQAGLGLQALLGAGQQDLAGKQLGLEANQQLLNTGAGLTGIGANEMVPANLGALASILSSFGYGRGFGGGAVSGQAK